SLALATGLIPPPQRGVAAAGDGSAAATAVPSPPNTCGSAMTPAVIPATTPAAIMPVATSVTGVVRGSGRPLTAAAPDRPRSGIRARRRAVAAQARPSTAANEPVSVRAAERQADDGVCAPSGTCPATGTGPLIAADTREDPWGRRTGSGGTASCTRAARG